MIDREKVVKGLECCMTSKATPICEECPYSATDLGTCYALDALHRDALELLKEQEARVPKTDDITAIKTLHKMLETHRIPHQYILEPSMGGATIKIPSKAAWDSERGDRISIIQYRGSYGGRDGLLECWFKTKKRNDKDPVGYVTVTSAFMQIKEAMGYE